MPQSHRPLLPLNGTSIERLLRDSSVKNRAGTAASVGAEFSAGRLTEKERRLALEILRTLAGDVDKLVREAVSEHIKRCPYVPPKLARKLAQDFESVAMPIIRYSKVLSDADLIAIVHNGSPAKQLAVAKREELREMVSDALVDTGNEKVVRTLLANRDAEIAEHSFSKIMDGFEGNDRIQVLLVDRPTLPLTVTKRLISCISGNLRKRLIDRHDFPHFLADELIMHGQERALVQALQPDTSVVEVDRMVADLHSEKALTPTLVLRALCMGDLHFFETAMASLASIPIENAKTLTYDRGPKGLEALYRKTGLPAELFRAFRAAVDVARDSERNPSTAGNATFMRCIRECLVREYELLCPEDLEFILSQLSHAISKADGGRQVPRSFPH